MQTELAGTQMQIQDCKSFGLNQCKPCGADAAATGNAVCLPGVSLSGSLPSLMEETIAAGSLLPLANAVVTIPGSIKEVCGCDTWGNGLVVLG